MSSSIAPAPFSSSAVPFLQVPEKKGSLIQFVFLLAGPGLMLLSGVRLLWGGAAPLVALLAAAVGFLACALYGIWQEKKGAWLFFRAALAASLLLGLLQAEGFLGSYGIVWLYAVPPAVFFFFGHREGVVWAASVLVAWLAGSSLSGAEIGSESILSRILASYTIASVLAYEVEWWRRRYMRELIQETEALRGTAADIETLQGFLPICSGCKSIRDDKGFWKEIGAYLQIHSMARVDVAFCPDCQLEAGSKVLQLESEAQERHAAESEMAWVEMPSGGVSSRRRAAGKEWANRRFILRICLITTLLLGLVFGSVDLWQGNFGEATLELGTAILFLGLIKILPRLAEPRPVFHFYGVFIIVLLAVELGIGGAGGHGFLWALLMPQVFFSLLGTTLGVRYSSVLLITVLGTYKLYGTELYGADVAFQCLLVYLLVAAMGFLLEFSREDMLLRLERESSKLAAALEHAETLRGLIPLCPRCHNVKDDGGFWTRVENYLTERAGTRLSHGLCPSCAERAMEDLRRWKLQLES